MIPNTERAAMRKRCDAATPGPWRSDGGRYIGIIAEVKGEPLQIGRAEECGRCLSDKQVEANADFMVNARSDLPAALDMIDELVGIAGRLLTELERVKVLPQTQPAVDAARDYLAKMETPQ